MAVMSQEGAGEGLVAVLSHEVWWGGRLVS